MIEDGMAHRFDNHLALRIHVINEMIANWDTQFISTVDGTFADTYSTQCNLCYQTNPESRFYGRTAHEYQQAMLQTEEYADHIVSQAASNILRLKLNFHVLSKKSGKIYVQMMSPCLPLILYRPNMRYTVVQIVSRRESHFYGAIPLQLENEVLRGDEVNMNTEPKGSVPDRCNNTFSEIISNERRSKSSSDLWEAPGSSSSSCAISNSSASTSSSFTSSSHREITNIILQHEAVSANDKALVAEMLDSSSTQDQMIKMNKFNYEMTVSKLRCFGGRQWINDECVNFLMKIFERNDYENWLKGDDNYMKSFFFNCFFMTTLLDGAQHDENKYSYKRVTRWTKNDDIFARKFVFLPINVANTHWLNIIYTWTWKRRR